MSLVWLCRICVLVWKVTPLHLNLHFSYYCMFVSYFSVFKIKPHVFLQRHLLSNSTINSTNTLVASQVLTEQHRVGASSDVRNLWPRKNKKFLKVFSSASSLFFFTPLLLLFSSLLSLKARPHCVKKVDHPHSCSFPRSANDLNELNV